MDKRDDIENDDKHDGRKDEAEQVADIASEQDRRNALNRIGRYSLYIAPVMLTMFSKQAHAS